MPRLIDSLSPARRRLLWGLLVVLVASVAWYLATSPRWRFGELPDFAAITEVGAMKQAFYGYLTPIIVDQNAAIQADRERLLALRQEFAGNGELSWWQRRWVYRLAERYEIEDPAAQPLETLLATLARRVDIIPLDLALAQAAKESGWGRSRFAVAANNLFGQWCYTPGCGIVPRSRRAGASYEVEAFPSVSEAIRRYMNNLNTHERYRGLRERRQRLREAGKPISGLALADGLLHYSEQREAYVRRLKAMIRQYRSMREEQAGT